MAALGIGRTFQNLALFPTMTVLQNVMVGVHCRTRSDFLSNALRLPWVGREERMTRERGRWRCSPSSSSSAWPTHPAAGLPFGTLKRVELARALAGQPKLLLLDEPAGGLNHEEVAALGAHPAGHPRPARRDRAARRAPHEPGHAGVRPGGGARLRPEDRRGPPAEVQRDPEVIRAYLGTSDGALMPALLEAGSGGPATAGPGSSTALALRGGGGRHHHHPGRQRRGQDHDPARGVRHGARPAAQVRFDGQRIDGKATEDIVRLGIAHAPEGRGTFVDLTVEENLRLGAYARRDRTGAQRATSSGLRVLPGARAAAPPAGGHALGRRAADAGGGARPDVAPAPAAAGRAVARPGPARRPRDLPHRAHHQPARSGVSVLLVEQNAALALDLADHAYLLETGRVVMSGPAAELQKDDAIRRSYLGY